MTDKIPQRGYIIAEPETSDGKRLIEQWRDANKPSRYFVPCAFIGSCIRAKKVHKQIFLDENWNPVDFHIHESLTVKVQRLKCKERILASFRYLSSKVISSSCMT